MGFRKSRDNHLFYRGETLCTIFDLRAENNLTRWDIYGTIVLAVPGAIAPVLYFISYRDMGTKMTWWFALHKKIVRDKSYCGESGTDYPSALPAFVPNPFRCSQKPSTSPCSGE